MAAVADTVFPCLLNNALTRNETQGKNVIAICGGIWYTECCVSRLRKGNVMSSKLILNKDQQAAEDAIVAAYLRGERRFLLIGAAGVGKTYLMQSLCARLSEMLVPSGEHYIRPVVTAPTHKAVQVLARKLDEAGIDYIECMTIHSLLGLKPTAGDTERQVLKRNPVGNQKTGSYDFVVLDEASMAGSELQKYIDSDLTFHFVLYVGDDAQLPPVGEDIAPCFRTVEPRNTFRLTKIVRQAEGNPILEAAAILRRQQQEGQADWSWTEPRMNADMGAGVYTAGGEADDWMKDAFTSGDFKKNNDAFRCIAYTNWRVKEINRKIRHWIYGETETPYVVGEQVLCRNPILDNYDRPVFSTNEEAIVTSIKKSVRPFDFSMLSAAAGQQAMPKWSVSMPVWEIGLRRLTDDAGTTACVASMTADEARYQELMRRLVTEAKANRNRWREYFDFIGRVADIRPVYALTAHSSQGSTFHQRFR
jgi:hypothetical protein